MTRARFTRADIAALPTPIDRLRAVMAALRDPERGCPWDLEQSFETIAPYSIEEAYEVRDAIQSGDRQALCDELGDLLLQAVYHAQLAEDEGSFDFDAVAQTITDKMLRRHPHVFDRDANPAEAAPGTGFWERHKAAERAARGQDQSALDGITGGLPALMRAEKLQKRAARVGFDWPDSSGVLAKLDEELTELRGATTPSAQQEELGDLLFTVVNLARKLGVDAEEALRCANDKFERRFRLMERQSAAVGQSLDQQSLDALETRWQQAKAQLAPRQDHGRAHSGKV